MPLQTYDLDEYGLAPKERKFCDILLTGKVPKYVAVSKAGYNCKPKSAVAAAKAGELLRKPQIAAYLRRKRALVNQKAEFGREEIVDFLVKTVKSQPDQAAMDNPLCEIDYVGKDGDAVARFMPKSKALERLSRILGLDAPKKIEISGTLKIVEYDLDLADGGVNQIINDQVQEAILIEDEKEEFEEESEPTPPPPRPKALKPKPVEKPKKLLKRAPLRR